MCSLSFGSCPLSGKISNIKKGHNDLEREKERKEIEQFRTQCDISGDGDASN